MAAATPSATRDPDSPYATTQVDFLLRTKACVEDRGYPVTLDLRQAGFEFALGDDTRAKEAGQALRDCMASIDPARLGPPPKLTEAQLVAWYAYRVHEAACLRAAGYAVEDAPPQRVFIDTNGDWDPFAWLAGKGMAVPLEAQISCEGVEGRPAFLGW